MSENQEPNHDLLEEAIHTFQRMSVPERPRDAEVLAPFGTREGDLPQPSRIPLPSKRRFRMHLLVSSTAAAVLLSAGLALFLVNSSPPESVQVAATGPSDKPRDDAVKPPPRREKVEREGLGSFKQRVADAQVIVVATALDSAPATPNRPGDLPEVLIRFEVKRVLKGEWAKEEITTRTPTAAAEFIGKDWVIFLSPDYVAGKHQLASHINVKLEPTVKSYLPKDNK
jgi:hypothetical protein